MQAVRFQKFSYRHLIHRRESINGRVVLRNDEIIHRTVLYVFEIVHDDGEVFLPSADKIVKHFPRNGLFYPLKILFFFLRQDSEFLLMRIPSV